MDNIIRFEESLYCEINENELIKLFNKGKSLLWGIKSDYGIYYKPFSKYDGLGNAIINHITEYNKSLVLASTYDIQIEPIYSYFVQL